MIFYVERLGGFQFEKRIKCFKIEKHVKIYFLSFSKDLISTFTLEATFFSSFSCFRFHCLNRLGSSWNVHVLWLTAISGIRQSDTSGSNISFPYPLQFRFSEKLPRVLGSICSQWTNDAEDRGSYVASE